MIEHLDNWQTFVTAACLSLGIMITRFLPFVLFGSRAGELPPVVAYLGRTLPFASMGMLLVYCLKDVSVAAAPHGLPELLGILLTGLLHFWRGNFLISIAGGTAFYMLLVQRVFV